MILCLVVYLIGLASSQSCSCQRTDPRGCACVATQTLQQKYFSTNDGLWPSEGFWNQGNALEALSNYNIYTRTDTYRDAIKKVIDTHPTPTVIRDGTIYFDDMQWWVLAYVRAYEATGNTTYLTQASQVFDHVYDNAWDNTCGGGVWWSAQKTYKNAITNELCLASSTKLYIHTKNQKYLQIAVAEWKWFEGSGMINSESLINDGLNNCKNNNGVTWTYNQGVILGGLSHLYSITKNSTLVSRINSIASAVLQKLVTSEGILVEPIPPDNNQDRQQFKGVFIRYLRYAQDIIAQTLQEEDKETREFTPERLQERRATKVMLAGWQDWLSKQANSLASNAYDKSTGNFGALWQGPLSGVGPVSQNSAIDCFNSAMQ